MKKEEGFRRHIHGTPYRQGDMIGDERWKVIDLIARGSTGTVYLAEDRNGNIVAVKTVDANIDDGERFARFESEVRKWAAIPPHQFILQLFEVREIGGVLFTSMEYIAPSPGRNGSSLKHILLHEGALSLEKTVKWAIQFCLGMEHLQGNGVKIYGDIKHDNILIGCDDNIKIADFGTVVVAGDSRHINAGTLEYLAPECFDGQGSVKSDIYSFGLVLYQMATARHPYDSCSHKKSDAYYIEKVWRDIHHKCQVPALSGPFTPLAQVIERCTAKNPDERFENFNSLRNELEKIAKRQAISIPRAREVSTSPEMRAAQLLSTGKLSKAEAIYSEILKNNPEDYTALKGIGQCYIKMARWDSALTHLQNAFRIADHADVELFILLARAFCEKGDFAQTDATFSKACAIFPRNPTLLKNRAECALKRGSKDLALKLYMQAARIYIDRRCRVEAFTTLRAVQDEFKDDLNLNRLLALAARLDEKKLYALNQSSEFLEAIDKIENDPEVAGILAGTYKRLWCCKKETGASISMQQHYLKKSLNLYLKAWEASAKTDTYVGINAASMSLLNGDVKTAREIAGHIISMYKNRKPEDALGFQVYYSGYWDRATFAEALLLNGDTAKAWKTYREALDIAQATGKKRCADSTVDQLELLLPALGINCNANTFLSYEYAKEQNYMKEHYRPDPENPYNPQPIATEDIELPDELFELVELLAENVHDIWAKKRLEEGWTWRQERNDELKHNPCLIPYIELPAKEKEYDRQMAVQTLKTILKWGYRIEK